VTTINYSEANNNKLCLLIIESLEVKLHTNFKLRRPNFVALGKIGSTIH
jgi:hypothetical protein